MYITDADTVPVLHDIKMICADLEITVDHDMQLKFMSRTLSHLK